MKVIYENKKTRVAKILFKNSKIQITNHALERFKERGESAYSDDKKALEALALEFYSARVVGTKKHNAEIPRDTEIHQTQRWLFMVDKLRKRITTCYLK